jgi:hypothetical protein
MKGESFLPETDRDDFQQSLMPMSLASPKAGSTIRTVEPA